MYRLTTYIRKTALLAFLSLFIFAGTAFGQAELAPGAAMAMKDRAMQSTRGDQVRLSDVKGSNGTVVIFWSNECPWVSKYEDRVLATISEFTPKGFGFVLVNANDPGAFPGESLEASQKRATSSKYAVPYVIDAGSELARAFGAMRTPHVYVFDASDKLIYVGTVDDSPGDPGNVKQKYLSDALNAVASGQPVVVAQTKAFGCNIRFK